MDSLANYGSDDDYEDSSDEQQKDCRQSGSNRELQRQPHPENQADDANYEEVQMDLSEESNDGSRNGRDKGSGDERRRNSPSEDRSRDDYRSRRVEERYRERSRDRRDDRLREKKDDRYGSKSDRYSRDYRRDSYRDRKRRRSTSRDRRSSSRDRKRSSSRERRYSRSPKRDRSRRSRSRSRSRGRYTGPQRRYGYPKNNGTRNADSGENSGGNDAANKDRFFMPGITGKYRDQIEKRKLLWQKKDPQKQQEAGPAQPSPTTAPSTSRVTKIWEATTFAQDQDGKVASKFKRLMGIKGQTDTTPVPPVDIIKKQEEMFSSMEQQYEVARTATHTMRGVGLGFSSSYPR